MSRGEFETRAEFESAFAAGREVEVVVPIPRIRVTTSSVVPTQGRREEMER